VILGVEDVFFGQTSLTLSGDYQTAFNGKRTAIGANLQYYSSLWVIMSIWLPWWAIVTFRQEITAPMGLT